MSKQPQQGDIVHLPNGLSLLLCGRARSQGAQPGTIVCEAVRSFASLSTDVRQIHLFEFSWSKLPTENWVATFIDRNTLDMARMAKIGCWSRHQVIIAALAWYLCAY